MTPRLVALTCIAMAAGGAGFAQDSTRTDSRAYSNAPASSYTYTSDYEVETWSVEDRRRQDAFGQNRFNAGDELLGGPVPQTERHDIRTTGYGDVRVVLTDTTRRQAADRRRGLKPGAQVQTVSGTPLGRVAMVERDTSGKVSTAWVQPPNANGAGLQRVPVRSIQLRNGRVIVDVS